MACGLRENSKLNMIKTEPLWTRKEIAALVGVTTQTVVANEKRWGLAAARVDRNTRCVRYKSRIAIVALQSNGCIVVA